MKLTVIIPTSNRPNELENTIKSLLRMKMDQADFEIIIVDNGKESRTKLIARKYATRFVNFQYFKENKPGLHNARNRGLRLSRTEILAFIDDDVEVSQNWGRTIIKTMQDKKYVLLGGPIIPKFNGIVPDWVKYTYAHPAPNIKTNQYLSLIDLGSKKIECDPRMIIGCNFIVRKDILLKSKGFHPDGFPSGMWFYRGDGETFVSDFISQINKKAVYIPGVSIRHVISTDRLNLKYFKDKTRLSGVSDSYSFSRHVLKSCKYRSQKHIREIIFALYRLISRDRYLSLVTAFLHLFDHSEKYEKIRFNNYSNFQYIYGFIIYQLALLSKKHVYIWAIKKHYYE